MKFFSMRLIFIELCSAGKNTFFSQKTTGKRFEANAGIIDAFSSVGQRNEPVSHLYAVAVTETAHFKHVSTGWEAQPTPRGGVGWMVTIRDCY